MAGLPVAIVNEMAPKRGARGRFTADPYFSTPEWRRSLLERQRSGTSVRQLARELAGQRSRMTIIADLKLAREEEDAPPEREPISEPERPSMKVWVGKEGEGLQTPSGAPVAPSALSRRPLGPDSDPDLIIAVERSRERDTAAQNRTAGLSSDGFARYPMTTGSGSYEPEDREDVERVYHLIDSEDGHSAAERFLDSANHHRRLLGLSATAPPYEVKKCPA